MLRCSTLQAVVSFFRWHPSEFRLELENPLELVVNDKAKYREVRVVLAARMNGDDGAGGDDAVTTSTEGEAAEAGARSEFDPEDVGLAKKSFSMDSTLGVPDQAWDPDRAALGVKDRYGYSMIPPSDLGYSNDGDVYFYRDNRETLKVLTEEEKKKILADTKKLTAAASRYSAQREEGVKINLAKGVPPSAHQLIANSTRLHDYATRHFATCAPLGGSSPQPPG